jgi:hypothetical protein
VDQIKHQTTPSGLVAGANACAVVTIKILVEQNQITPMGIGLKLLVIPINGATTSCILQEDIFKSLGDFGLNLVQSQIITRSGGIFNLK